MNSIAELNTKWWYRLIKVIYILFFLIIATITIIEALVISELTGNEASFIQCPNGTGLGLAEIGLRFGEDKPADFDEFIRQLKVARLEGKLGDTPENQYKITIKLLRHEFPQYNGYIEEEKIQILCVSVAERNLIHNIGYSLLALLAVTIVFEVLRRVFYYVVLGKLRPAK